jgi:hypothetical protein
VNTTDLQVEPEQILSLWNREILSANAVKMYTAVWFRMRNSNSAQVWMSDEDISRRARLLIQFVPSARLELAKARLLECKQGNQDWLYSYQEQSCPEFDDDHTQDIEAAR